MPAWGMHLYIADKINNVIKKDENEFFIGNVLPDIYSGWIIKDASKVLNYDITHYSNKYIINDKVYTLPDYERFIIENSHIKKDTIFLGYLSHLMSDYYFNNYAFKNHYINKGEEIVGIIDSDKKEINCDKEYAREAKQGDFNYLSNKIITKVNFKEVIIDNKIIGIALKIKNIDIKEEDLYKVEKYLNNLLSKENNKYIEDLDYNYKMFSKEELEMLLNSCINFILEKFKEYSLI